MLDEPKNIRFVTGENDTFWHHRPGSYPNKKVTRFDNIKKTCINNHKHHKSPSTQEKNANTSPKNHGWVLVSKKSVCTGTGTVDDISYDVPISYPQKTGGDENCNASQS